MIARLLSPFSRVTGAFVSSAVLMREASRTSRQWQTYAARTAFSGFMLSVLLAGIYLLVSAPRFVDPASMGEYGRYFFIGFAIAHSTFDIPKEALNDIAAPLEY